MAGEEKAIANAQLKLDAAFKLTAQKVEARLEAKTPVLTGEAQRAWRIEGTLNALDIVNQVPYIKILEFGQKARKRRVFKSGKKKGQVRVARSLQYAAYMVTSTTTEADEIGREVAQELNQAKATAPTILEATGKMNL